MPEINNKPLPPKKACEYCGKEFQPNLIGTPQKFCSRKCGHNFTYHKNKNGFDPESPRAAQKLGTAKCAECGAEFKPNPNGRPRIYCSDKCKDKARNIRGGEKRREEQRASLRKHYANHKEAYAEYNKKWIGNHPEKRAEYSQAYRQRNPEKTKEAVRSYNERNRDKVLEYKRKYHKDNKEKEKEYQKNNRDNLNKIAREWQAKKRQENREEYRQKQKGWRDKYPETYRAKQHRRRTRKTNAGGSYTTAEWNALLDECGHRCVWCGNDGIKLTVDHIVPVSKGGSSNIDNIQPLCLPCNARKNDRIMDFRRKNAA
jgi:predicted nucleic acid-binding Zn ribbon protein